MKISKLMLGTVQFGLNYGIANTAGKPSFETVCRIVRTAYDGGVNCLDTAAGYGDSEEVLGRVLTELQLRGKMQVISKIPSLPSTDLTMAQAEKFITESVENSLKKLRLESLTACLFHKENDIKYIECLRRLEHRGLIECGGVSLDSNQYCGETLAANVKCIQLSYNVLDKRFDRFLSEAQARGILIFTRSVYLQGLLLMPEENINASLHDVIPIRRKLEQLAEEAGMEMSELCMRFVLSNPAVTSVLTGVDNEEQMRENLELFDLGPLPEELYLQIQAEVPELPEKIIRPFFWKK